MYICVCVYIYMYSYVIELNVTDRVNPNPNLNNEKYSSRMSVLVWDEWCVKALRLLMNRYR